MKQGSGKNLHCTLKHPMNGLRVRRHCRTCDVEARLVEAAAGAGAERFCGRESEGMRDGEMDERKRVCMREGGIVRTREAVLCGNERLDLCGRETEFAQRREKNKHENAGCV